MTRDLRKQALGLESGKAMSRKARSKQGTPSTSRANSAAASRNASSRNSSEDEEDSVISEYSSASADGDEVMATDLAEANEAMWISAIRHRIEAILERKRNGSAADREKVLVHFGVILTESYAQEHVKNQIRELAGALARIVKSGQTETEVTAALKDIALLVVTEPSDAIFDTTSAAVKSTILDSEYSAAKVAAVQTLSIITFYGGAAEDEMKEVMEFLIDIASSDGAMVDEADNADLVATSLQEWGFLATQVNDLEDHVEMAMETFVDQLDSADTHVQIAAGENIALVYEKAHEDMPDHAVEEYDDGTPKPAARYCVSRSPNQLLATLTALAKVSTKRLSKRDRKDLHVAFKDILNTVERPARGPKYSLALDEEGREMGSRMKVNVGGGVKMGIESWWKLHRLQGLKRLLQGGFLTHYQRNEVVRESLPVEVEED